MKSSIDIADDVYGVLRYSPLVSRINGALYKGKRGHNSDKEDVVVSVNSNLPLQSQSAFVYVNIYVAGVDVNGQNERDDQRMRTLAQLAFEALDNVRGEDFKFSIEEQNDEEVEGKNEFVIVNKMLYQIINE